MGTPKRFPPEVVQAIHRAAVLGVQAGTRPHRAIGIWVVVVEGRVFVRSWSMKERGWYRTFLAEPRGTIHVGDRAFPARACMPASS